MSKRKRLSFDSPMMPRISGPATPLPIAGQVGDAAATAALSELSDRMEEARETGRMILDLPHDQIVLDHLVRDRLAASDDDMDSLVESLRARGQQVPIEVTRLGPDSYGLISGWRRCQALQRLHEDTGEARFATVQALIRPQVEAPQAYRAMVEENEIRAGLSYYERARIVARAVEQGVFDTKRTALQELFAAASRAKRSKIGTFLPIVTALDGHLRFPQALTERTGLTLGRAFEDDPTLAKRAQQSLKSSKPADANAEAACLLSLLQPETPAPAPHTPASVPREVAKKPAQTQVTEPLCPGVDMQCDGTRIVLTGGRVDARLADRLRGFLAHDKASD
jgi:ParB/RepB/Spo0J family partition protein